MTVEIENLIATFVTEADTAYDEWQAAEVDLTTKEDEYKDVLLEIKNKPTIELLKSKVELSKELEHLSELTRFAREVYQGFVESHYDNDFRGEISNAVRNDDIPKNELDAELAAITKLKEFIQAYDSLKALQSERARGYARALIPYRTHLDNANIPISYGDAHLTNGYKQTKLIRTFAIDRSDMSQIERDINLFPTLKSKATKFK